MNYYAGIDVGSGRTKLVLISEDNSFLLRKIAKTSVPFSRMVDVFFEEINQEYGISRDDIAYIATTGLGRYAIPYRQIQITELTSAGRGVISLFPGTRSILDIGAQSTRAIRIDSRGRVLEFKQNDKCAAGSGSFIVKAAKYLEVPLSEVGRLSMQAMDPQPISSICAVLAESEIINLVTRGVKVEDILKGIHDSLADRAIALLRRVSVEEEITFIGGVAVQDGMVASLQEKLGVKVNVPDHPEFVVAYGAALLARWRAQKLTARV
ncbi:MAG: acyl-CoA dehydratase activase [bacterium]